MSDPRVIHVVIDREDDKHDSRDDTALGKVISSIVDTVESLRGGNEENGSHSIWDNKEEDRGNYGG